MKKNTQIILYSLLGVATLVGVYFLLKKPKEDTTTKEEDEKPEVDEQKIPDKKLEELLTSKTMKVGTKLFTKVDMVNVRDTRKVDDANWTNLYGTIAKKGTLLGTFMSVKKGADGFNWIGVKLSKNAYDEIQEAAPWYKTDIIKTIPPEKYVREDVVKV